MVDTIILVKKINAIRYNMSRIMKYKDVSLEEFIRDEDIRDIMAHNLFMLLQHVIDIGTNIIADGNMEEPVFVSDIADILKREGVLDNRLANSLKSMIGLRNIIAHEYGDIDFGIIHRIITEHIIDVDLFLDRVIKYVQL
jgi:uncharacterized protein YutE (UPF0331/DUF86 family)